MLYMPIPNFNRYGITPFGQVKNLKTNKIMSQSFIGKEKKYLRVNIKTSKL